MNVIQQPSVEVLKILGIPTYNPKDTYRLSKFLLFYDREDGTKMIYNTLTKAFVSMPAEQFTNMYASVENYAIFLRRNYFLVKDDFDEYAAARKIFDLTKIKPEDRLKDVYEWTILTTTECNARCFYCYEKGRSQIRMTLDTADKVADMIIESHNKNIDKLDRKEELRWFGGEPTYNAEIIDHICKRLHDNGVPYVSSFTSNGYLFDEHLVDKAVKEWKMTNIQVTIDGTEEIYNKAKRYIYDDPSPYKTVISNVETLLKHNVPVSIRMNLELYNHEDLKKLIIELQSSLGSKYNKPNKKKLFNMYVWPIFDESNRRTDEHKTKLYAALDDVNALLETYGYGHGDGLDARIKRSMCMVDSGHELMISPDGHMGLCEHWTDSHFVTSLDRYDHTQATIDMDEVSWLGTKVEHGREICGDCPLYPVCFKIQGCTELSKCDRWIKEWAIKKRTVSLKDSYESYLKNEHKKAGKANNTNNPNTTKENCVPDSNPRCMCDCQNNQSCRAPEVEELHDDPKEESFFKRVFDNIKKIFS